MAYKISETTVIDNSSNVSGVKITASSNCITKFNSIFRIYKIQYDDFINRVL